MFSTYHSLNSKLHDFYRRTRWKFLLRHCGLRSFYMISAFKFVIVLFVFSNLHQVAESRPGKLILFNGLRRLQTSTKQCQAGVYSKEPAVYTCACITGVWGFYENYCEKPITIAGGDNFCFRLRAQSMSGVVPFGNPVHPFESSLSIFHEDFKLLKEFHTDDNDTSSDPLSAFVTITDTSWTIYGNSGDGVCLKATTSGKRKFCLFGKRIPSDIGKIVRSWKRIVKVKKGCLSQKYVRRADSCAEILPPNDLTDCSLDILEETATEPINDVTSSETELPPTTVDTIEPPSTANPLEPPTTADPTGRNYGSNTTGRFEFLNGWIRIRNRKPTKTLIISTTEMSTSVSVGPSSTKMPNGIDSESSEEWVPLKYIHYDKSDNTISPSTSTASTTTEVILPDTTTKRNEIIDCELGLSRDKVKTYWLDPTTNACSKSINEAVFTDQLQRFTVKHFDKIFPSRLKSLTEMENLLNVTKQIMMKTCSEEYVPAEFFEVAYNAMMMFVREDFFYGVEGAIPDYYKRIVKSLGKCLERAKPFIFESDPLECGIEKINGKVVLRGGKKEQLEVPEKSSNRGFEPLIETIWKMFLHAHSLCFPDFTFSNDHHHFSVLVMELFSKSIYEKWIEPIDSNELYSFILPKYHFLKDIMENIDYCVAAASTVSPCPVWMSRSGVNPNSRKRRSIWMGNTGQDKKRSDIWDGQAYCLQKSNEPELHMNFPTCGS